MKRGIVLICLLALCVSIPTVTAWGSDGHRIVAQIAQELMSPSAWSACKTQLGSLNLADIATLPDSYDHDPQGSWSSHLHYVDNPTNSSFFVVNPTCVESDGCVVTAIYNYTYILSKSSKAIPKGICSNNSTASNMKEPCALSFLTHFVGDVHQPLHAGFEVDVGGNAFSVQWYNSQTNLHSVWDSQIIYKYEDTSGDGSWQGMANDLLNEIHKNPKFQYEWGNQTDPRLWANESFSYVRLACYNMEPGSAFFYSKTINSNFNQVSDSHSHSSRSPDVPFSCTCPQLGDSYYGRNIPIVKERLMQAGIRLASVLDLIYDPSFSSSRPFPQIQEMIDGLMEFNKIRAARKIVRSPAAPRCSLDDH